MRDVVASLTWDNFDLYAPLFKMMGCHISTGYASVLNGQLYGKGVLRYHEPVPICHIKSILLNGLEREPAKISLKDDYYSYYGLIRNAGPNLGMGVVLLKVVRGGMFGFSKNSIYFTWYELIGIHKTYEEAVNAQKIIK